MKILLAPVGRKIIPWLVYFLAALTAASGQENPSSKEKDTYSRIKSFALASGSIDVNNLVIKKDRVHITLTGTVYPSALIDGRVTGAVFMGAGKFSVETPPSEFEKENLKRLFGVDAVESDFSTAVFRFTDDTDRLFGQVKSESAVNDRAQKKAIEVDARILKETGVNLAGRTALSLQNVESPGFFFANFEGGKRGRFSFIFDPQCRIPAVNFKINGGEKGVIWSYIPALYDNEIWLAFYSLQNYERGLVEYSDAHDQIDNTHYDLDLDLREHKKSIRVAARISAVSLQSNLRALAFNLGEDLSEYENHRLTKQLRLKSARLGGEALAFAQEDWEGGFTLFLNRALKAGEKLDLDLILEGDFMYDSKSVADCHYPRSSATWLPRHGYLDRATFTLTFHHPKSLVIASGGARTSESPDPESKNTNLTRYEMAVPVPIVTFALAPFERHTSTIKWDNGKTPTPLEFASLAGYDAPIKEAFILAELSNTARYMSAVFGDYPYPSFGAAFHPFSYGLGFPTLLMIPAADRSTNMTFAFIAHETAHQWWGNIVSWRSYRDQWLSEGFAEYSGVLYTGFRMNREGMDNLVRRLRTSLIMPPETRSGIGKGRLVDVGPLILGHRVSSSKSLGAYETLIYNKGALVLRMIHFMLSEPGSGDPKAFFDAMTDFANRYRNKAATTDDFRAVINEHFAKSPIAKTYNIRDLNWLFRQSVYETALPSYELQYTIEDLPDGKAVLSGKIVQQNAPANWAMVLPVRLSFEKGNGVGTVLVMGASSDFRMHLPMRPKKVELDPDHWIMSEKISTKRN